MMNRDKYKFSHRLNSKMKFLKPNDETKDAICVLPWNHIATQPNGELRLCCNSAPNNQVLDENGKPFKMDGLTDFNAYWNSKWLKTIRIEMVGGVKPSVCKKCYNNEALGLSSPRISYNTQYADTLSAASNMTEESGAAPPNIEYIDLRFGNLCNLKCRMCFPGSSSQWVDEWNILYPNSLSDAKRIELKNMVWYENDSAWRSLFAVLEHVDTIYLTGGEPTLAVAQYKLLDKCIKNGVAKNITLKYNINLTNIPRKLVNYWAKFKSVILNCSVDAYGELNTYIRYPGKWSLIEKNLKKLDAMNSVNANLNINIHSTIQIYNVLHLTELFDHILKGYSNVTDFPLLNILDMPRHFNIRALPKPLKEIAAARLQDWKKENIGDVKAIHFVERIDGLISAMFSEDWSDAWPEFWRQTRILDVHRHDNILDHVPEFTDYQL